MKSTVKFIATGVFVLGLSMPVTAQDISEDRVAEFVAVIAQNNCVMNEKVAAVALPENGFTDKSETKSIVGLLLGRGDARLDGNMLTLTAGDCGQTNTGTPAERLVAAIIANNCSMTQSEAETLLPAAGIGKDETRLLVGALLGDGSLSIVDGALTVSNEQCGETHDPVLEKFVEVVVANGCKINKEQARELLPPAGVPNEKVDGIVEMLVASHQATIGSEDGRSVVVLSDQVCTSGSLSLAPADDLRTQFIAFMATRNCKITFDQAKIDVPAAGMDLQKLDNIVDDMMDAGVATVGDPNQTLTLSPEICS